MVSLNVGDLLQDFEAHCALPRDHDFIVERMNKGHAELLAAAHRFFAGFVIIRAVKNDFRAVAFGGGNLD